MTAQRHLARSRQESEDIAVLLLEGRHGRHHRLHKPGALGAMGPKAPLAPEGSRPNGPLGSVVRGLHPFVTYERPQGLPQLAVE